MLLVQVPENNQNTYFYEYLIELPKLFYFLLRQHFDDNDRQQIEAQEDVQPLILVKLMTHSYFIFEDILLI